MIRAWVDNLRAAWRRFVRRHSVVPDPYDAPLPHHQVFIVNGTMLDLEGLRAWAHGQMFPKSVRKQTWN